MKFRTFRYLLSEGFKNVWSHRLMSIASSGVLMACMLMIGIVFSLSANIDNYVSEIQQNAVVMVFFKDDMSRDDALAASEAIKNLDNINDVKFVSKEDGLSSQEDSMGEEYKEIFAILQDDNPLPDGAQVTIDDLEKYNQTVEEIRGVSGVDIIRQNEGADPGSVLFDALQAAKARGVDVVLCDTAGRLHNKQNLMNELAKLRKIIARECPDSVCETLLVLDATTGQNGLQQAMLFEFLIDVQHLTNRRVKPGQQLTAHNENINLTVAKFVLHGFFVSVSIAILFHHLFPVFDNLMIGAFIDVIHTFPHIRGRNGNRTIQVTKLLKAFQIANGIPLIVGS